MGKWIKLLNSSGGTVCLKYAPGYDRFIDHGFDRTTWAVPLRLAASFSNSQSNFGTPLEPTEQSLNSYVEYLSRPSNVALHTANNDKRFISLTNPSQGFTVSDSYTETSSGDAFNVSIGDSLSTTNGPFFNLVDAYTLVDLHVTLRRITSNNPPNPPVVTAWEYAVVAVVQAPGDVHSPEYAQDSVGSRWRLPLAQPLIFDVATPVVGYEMLDYAYDQLEEIFGPF